MRAPLRHPLSAALKPARRKMPSPRNRRKPRWPRTRRVPTLDESRILRTHAGLEFGTMNANASRLEGITRDLWNQWLLATEYWQDAKAKEFQQKYLEELVAGVNKSVGVIEQ